jgi:hypothetical protein
LLKAFLVRLPRLQTFTSTGCIVHAAILPRSFHLLSPASAPLSGNEESPAELKEIERNCKKRSDGSEKDGLLVEGSKSCPNLDIRCSKARCA